MGANENFCLRWNDFETNVSSAFRDLRNESDFFDVTLACDDNPNRTLQAHKVILASCSSFFKKMLRRMALASPGNANPLIYLRGVRMVDLESVLDFMYHGEVNVAQDDLNTFLGVAEDLQIKGLTQQSKDMGSSNSSSKKSRKPNSSFPGPGTGTSGNAAKRARKDYENTQDQPEDKDPVNVKSEPAVFDNSAAGPSTSRVSQQSFVDGGGGVNDDGSAFGEETFEDGGFGYDDNEATGDGLDMDGQDSAKGRHRTKS